MSFSFAVHLFDVKGFQGAWGQQGFVSGRQAGKVMEALEGNRVITRFVPPRRLGRLQGFRIWPLCGSVLRAGGVSFQPGSRIAAGSPGANTRIVEKNDFNSY